MRLKMRLCLTSLAALAALTSLGGCSQDAPAPEPVATEVPKNLRNAPARAAIGEIGTPMKDRVATLGLLNKRNNLTQDLKLKPGEARRVGNIVVRLSACERTAPWEMPRETGAFVQVLVLDAGTEDSWRKVFSGWLFRNSPSANVVEHPIYDVWVKDCAMRFPGEEEPAPESDASPSPSTTPGARPASPAPSPSASPARSDDQA